MTEVFSVPLCLVGVGYRAVLEDDPRGTENGGGGKRSNVELGFSHSVFVPIPPHIKVEVLTATKIVLSCTGRHQLGLFAARVKKWRPPEPYKGKVRLVSDNPRVVNYDPHLHSTLKFVCPDCQPMLHQYRSCLTFSFGRSGLSFWWNSV